MKQTWIHHAAYVFFASALLHTGAAIADGKSDMEKRMLECAATTATNKLGECLAAKGAPAVSATESETAIQAAVVKCMERGVTGTTELGSCVNSRLDETKAQPVDVTDAQVDEAARLCAKHYTETEHIVVCVNTILRHTEYVNPK
jgi:negative regulator of replication initiation